MDFTAFSNNLKAIKLTRNYALCLNIFFAFLIVILLFINLLRSNQHTTVVIPATLTAPVTIKHNSVDAAYLSQWTEFIANLKLNVTPDTAAFKQNSLLAYVASVQYGTFKSHLITEQDNIKQNEISMVFYPSETKVVSNKDLITQISGLLRVYIGDELNSSAKVTYELQFNLDNGRLLLRSFKEVTRV